MTIDEAIKYLRALKRCETCEEGDIGRCKSCSCYRIGSSAKCYDAIDVGVDTMCKYQKITEIAEKCNLKLLPKEGMNVFQKEILEVLEDGNL